MAKYVTFPLNNTEYRAEDMQLWHSTRGNGVYSEEGELTTTFKSGMIVTISEGRAWIGFEAMKGVIFGNMESVDLTVDMADGLLNRTDYVVIKYDIFENKAYLYIKKGTESNDPQPPTLERDINIAYELAIAEISIPAGTVELNQALISDKRLDEYLCGIMKDGVTSIPTAALQEQWESWFNSTTVAGEAEWNNWFNSTTTAGETQWENWYNTNTTLFGNQFTTWFDNVVDTLSDDQAGNLLTLINANADNLDSLAGVDRTTETVKGNADDIDALDTELVSHEAETTQQLTTKMDKQITDDTLEKKYELGMNNGLLYYREVEE